MAQTVRAFAPQAEDWPMGVRFPAATDLSRQVLTTPLQNAR